MSRGIILSILIGFVSLGLIGFSSQDAFSIDSTLETVFLMDGSGSLGSSGFVIEKTFVNNIIQNGLPSDSPVGLVLFATGANTLYDFSDDQDRTALTNFINNIVYPGGNTYTKDAVLAGMDIFDQTGSPQNNKLMFLITDGNPTTSPPQGVCDNEDIKNMLDSRGIKVVIIGIGNAWDPNMISCIVDDASTDIIDMSSFSDAAIAEIINQLIDSDGDGIPDDVDTCPGHDDNVDIDGDGIPDGCDTSIVGDPRCSGNGTYDSVTDSCTCFSDGDGTLGSGNGHFTGASCSICAPNFFPAIGNLDACTVSCSPSGTSATPGLTFGCNSHGTCSSIGQCQCDIGFEGNSCAIPSDSDNDGIPDSADLCPFEDATGQDSDGDGCIDTQADSDGDGIPDDIEAMCNVDVSNMIVGTANADWIIGTNQNDVIFGGDGDDLIFAGKGHDCVFGEGGDDWIFGRQGNDEIHGGAGDDAIRANAGNDLIFGDAGNDALEGMKGDDTINGGDGNDIIFGGAGADTINGDAGNDRIRGNQQNDSVNGDAGNDMISGGLGDDAYDGGADTDMCVDDKDKAGETKVNCEIT